jgi:hypothetical protein
MRGSFYPLHVTKNGRQLLNKGIAAMLYHAEAVSIRCPQSSSARVVHYTE